MLKLTKPQRALLTEIATRKNPSPYSTTDRVLWRLREAGLVEFTDTRLADRTTFPIVTDRGHQALEVPR